jgi:hypothetical protein
MERPVCGIEVNEEFEDIEPRRHDKRDEADGADDGEFNEQRPIDLPAGLVRIIYGYDPPPPKMAMRRRTSG